jgi:hypothetical protein
VDPVPDPLLLRKSGGAGNRTRVARNSDCLAVTFLVYIREVLSLYPFRVSPILSVLSAFLNIRSGKEK